MRVLDKMAKVLDKVLDKREKGKKRPPILSEALIEFSARKGTRTPTPVRTKDFESFASAIPPLGQINIFVTGRGTF